MVIGPRSCVTGRGSAERPEFRFTPDHESRVSIEHDFAGPFLRETRSVPFAVAGKYQPRRLNQGLRTCAPPPAGRFLAALGAGSCRGTARSIAGAAFPSSANESAMQSA